MEGRILSCIGADKVIFPDRAMGIRVGNDIMNGNYFEAIELSDEYSIVDMAVPSNWAGKNIGAVKYPLTLWHQYYRYPRIEETNVNPSASYALHPQDVLIVLGHNTEIQKLREMKE